VVHNGVAALRCGGGDALVADARAPAIVGRPGDQCAASAAAVIEPSSSARFRRAPLDTFDAIVTSGDVCARPDRPRRRPSRPMFRLGPPRDRPLVAGLDAPARRALPRRRSMSSAPASSTTRPKRRRNLCRAARRLRSPAASTLICANPDLVVERGRQDRALRRLAGSSPMRSSAAEAIYAGKPHAPIYDLAIRLGAG
jgi:ribonucleotide monophosphatase NagD (HAD superfamily)